ncbi:TetR/AcrR family transcriptional regulator [Paenisporosarcina antarctica]|uniref:TetR/AcrR family transcriptional regulator n=1 Tax=Paenisporosarcina antarctica TaxID=417367 RepID=A0A4P7A055_9BACL|nr:TetR/AcrR family transcriptional regulator [Paenisporosarcina antarctica]QBP41948.1 TetR/AcrR family transcriptional regulator [Paenisporosarcina antarctica]
MKKVKISTKTKDDGKIDEQRKKILESTLILFKEKGYHRTTTREIAKSANMSSGSIYGYVNSKDDILYLFYEALYDQLNIMINEKIRDIESKGLSRLKSFVKEYFLVIDEISDQTSIMYSESRSLSELHLKYVLSKENEFSSYVKNILLKSIQEESIFISEDKVSIVAHNIIVQGHMWAFRGWTLKQTFTLEGYINVQTELLIDSIVDCKSREKEN